MSRDEEIEVMSKKDNPHNERLELAKHLQGLSEDEYNQTVTSVDNDRRNWGDGAWYGAHWADNNPHKRFMDYVKQVDNSCSWWSLMHYLDENRPEDKMCLSNGECTQIEKAWRENDWKTIIKYIKKYA